MVPLERYDQILSVFNFNEFSSKIPLLFVLVLLLFLSAFFSISETVYSSVNIIRLRNYMDEKVKGAKKAVYIAEKYDITLTTILVGNNLVNIASTTIAAYIISTVITQPSIANIINTVIMTIIILIFGEILPKSYGKSNADKVALKLSGPLYFTTKLLFPITWLFLKMQRSIVKKNESIPSVTEDELETIIDVMETEGIIQKTNAELIQSALNLDEKNVIDIMTPRVDMIAVDISDSVEEIRDLFFEYQFSRVPVYEDDKDNIIGILSERDFFTAYIKNPNHDVDLRKIISKPYYVSKTKKVDDLIREMQNLKKHFAIVSDEYGGTSGIVTMEDALEELVGEIYDEYDEYVEEDDAEKIVQIEDNKYLISADMELDYLFEELKLGNEPETRFTNVGGFVYELSADMPITGNQITINSTYEEDDLENPIHIDYEITFTIDKVQNRRIKTLIVEVKVINENING
ncbi:MAG: hemolysin family protein [Bacilli bacterium]